MRAPNAFELRRRCCGRSASAASSAGCRGCRRSSANRRAAAPSAPSAQKALFRCATPSPASQRRARARPTPPTVVQPHARSRPRCIAFDALHLQLPRGRRQYTCPRGLTLRLALRLERRRSITKTRRSISGGSSLMPTDANRAAPPRVRTRLAAELAPARVRHPPGPRGWPYVGCLNGLLRNPMKFWSDIANRYGGIARVPLMNGHVAYLVSDPDLLYELWSRTGTSTGRTSVIEPPSSCSAAACCSTKATPGNGSGS